MKKISYSKIAQNGGIYDTRKYRYMIDTSTGEVKRCELSKLGTTAMLDPDVWQLVK